MQNDSAIDDVVDVSRDTIIAIPHSLGIIITVDNGKTWHKLGQKQIFIKEATVDNKGILWGFDSWKGIHEASYSRIFRSNDFGKTWNPTEFDPNTFFPYHIYSKVHQPLEIVTFNRHIYQLTGNNVKTDWKYIDTIPAEPEHFGSAFYLPPYDVDEYDTLKLYKKINGKTDTLLKLGNAGEISSIIKIKDTLFLAGSTKQSTAYFATVINEKKYKAYNLPGTYASVIEGKFGRIWVMDDKGLFLKQHYKLVRKY